MIYVSFYARDGGRSTAPAVKKQSKQEETPQAAREISAAHCAIPAKIASGSPRTADNSPTDIPVITRQISSLLEDEAFVEIDDFGGGIAHQGRRWYPEDMVLAPDIYLQGIDEGQRGKDLAVEKWLELESEGWIRCGFGAPNRTAFEQKLIDLQKNVAKA